MGRRRAFEPAVVGFDGVVGVLLGHVQRRRGEFVEDPQVCLSGSRTEQSSRPVDEDLLGGCWLVVVVGSFDEFAVDELRAGADEGDEAGCVDGSPAVLGGFDEFECHRQPGGAGAGPAGDLRAVPDGREGAFNRVRGP